MSQSTFPHVAFPIVVTGGVASVVSAGMLFLCAEPVRRAVYFWVNAGPIVAHYKFTKWWLGTRTTTREHRDAVYGRLHNRYCQPALNVVLNLKGLYVKIGQVLSSRPDFMPRQYIELLVSVQDSIPQWPYHEIDKIVRDSLLSEHGLEWSDVFESMDETALGSASIGQCHRAVLKPAWGSNRNDYVGGEVVAVKVMDPNAESRFRHDFQVFRWLCRVALPGWTPFIDELERQLMTEFDYKNEAANLDEVRTNMMKSKYSSLISIPQPHNALCSKHLLVMEMLEGKKLSDAIEDKLAEAIGVDRREAKDFINERREALFYGPPKDSVSAREALLTLAASDKGLGPLTRAAQRAHAAAKLAGLYRFIRSRVDLLVDVHGHQIFIDGVFNGDCHPGNTLELSNGKLGLIDYGQTKRLDAQSCQLLARTVSMLGDNKIQSDQVAQSMRALGFQTKKDDAEMLVRYAKLFFDSDMEARKWGCATPQEYLLKLAELDPLEKVPDSAVFVARTSFLFRGMGSLVNEQVETAKRWKKHAKAALLAPA